MIRQLYCFGLATAVLLAGCQGWNLRDPEVSPLTSNGETPVVNDQPAEGPLPGRLLMTPENTQITFRGKAGLMTQSGSFQRFSGQLDLQGNRPQDAKLEVQIEMDSVKTRIGLLTRHLKSDDFFEVDVFPTASFVSTVIQPTESPNRYQVQGRLTIHGVTRTVTIPATIQIRANEVLMDMEWIVRQTDYRMEKGAKHAKDEVPITVTASISRNRLNRL